MKTLSAKSKQLIAKFVNTGRIEFDLKPLMEIRRAYQHQFQSTFDIYCNECTKKAIRELNGSTKG